MNDSRIEEYWQSLPDSKETAARYDNGDDLILIRSSVGCGFYKTNDRAAITAYRAELTGRGRKLFAQLRKIDRVLNADPAQLSFTNNLRAVRLLRGMKQEEVCERMKDFEPTFDVSTLSKMENDRCLPTPYQLAHLACILRCTASDLVDGYFIEGGAKTREINLQVSNTKDKGGVRREKYKTRLYRLDEVRRQSRERAASCDYKTSRE